MVWVMADSAEEKNSIQRLPDSRSLGRRKHPSGALESIEQKIAEAKSPMEAAYLVRLRDELLRQDEALADRQQKRLTERSGVIFHRFFSVFVVLIGVALIYLGIDPGTGIFLIGAGLSSQFPEFVKRNFPGPRNGGSNE